MQTDVNGVHEHNEKLTLAEAERLLGELAAISFSDASADEGPTYAPFAKQQTRRAERPDIEARYRALVEQLPAVVFMVSLDQGSGEA